MNSPLLSLIISTKDDPYGTLITILSAREEFTVTPGPHEIIIVDNSSHPENTAKLQRRVSFDKVTVYRRLI